MINKILKILLICSFVIMVSSDFSLALTDTDKIIVNIGVITAHIEEKDLNSLPLTPETIIQFLELTPALRLDHFKKKMELEYFSFLMEVFSASGFEPRFLIYQIREFDSRKKITMPENVFTSTKLQGIKTIIDLRRSGKADLFMTDKLKSIDSLLRKYDDLIIISSTGDNGNDNDKNGVTNTESATGEFIFCKNSITVGTSEDFNPVYNGSKKYSDFPVDPIKNDLIADSRNGLAAFSGKGIANGRVPNFVIDSTSIKNGKITELKAGTMYSAIFTCLAIEEARLYFTTNKKFPDPSRSLLKAFLVSMTNDMRPGQYGGGKFMEIDSRPHPGAGFGKLDTLNDFKEMIKFEDNRTGLRLGLTRKIDFKLKNMDRAKIVVVLDYPDHAGDTIIDDLDLIIKCSNGTNFFPEFSSEFRTTEMIEFTAIRKYKYTICVNARNVKKKHTPYAIVIRTIPLK